MGEPANTGEPYGRRVGNWFQGLTDRRLPRIDLQSRRTRPASPVAISSTQGITVTGAYLNAGRDITFINHHPPAAPSSISPLVVIALLATAVTLVAWKGPERFIQQSVVVLVATIWQDPKHPTQQIMVFLLATVVTVAIWQGPKHSTQQIVVVSMATVVVIVVSIWLASVYSPQGAPTRVSGAPPPPRIFFGRDEIVNRIASQLASGASSFRICILGAGGMGKTSTATAIINHRKVRKRFHDSDIYWISCITAISPSSFLYSLSRSLGIHGQTEDIRPILQRLQERRKSQLLVLDNFETPWHPVEGSQRKVKEMLEALDALANLAIIVTMRSELPPLHHWSVESLPSLTLEDSQRIYRAINERVSLTYDGLDTLLQAIGHLPYAITLMATRARASFSSPAQLLAEWNEAGPTMISSFEDGMDYSIQLSVNSSAVARSPGALHLLQVLSMLPVGVFHSDLSVWIPDSKSDTVSTLRDVALIQTTTSVINDVPKHHLFVLPVIQSYMDQGDRIPAFVRKEVHAAALQLLRKHKDPIETPDNPGFQEAITAIHSQESNLHALLVPIIQQALAQGSRSTDSESLQVSPRYDPPWLLEPLLAYVWYLRWSKPERETIEGILQLARNASDTRCEAEIMKALNEISGRYDDRYRDLMKASSLFDSLGDFVKASITEFAAIFCLSESLAKSDPADQAHILMILGEARAKWEAREVYQQNGIVKAVALYWSGATKAWCGNNPEFLDEIQEAKEIYVKLGKRHQVARCAYRLARGYASFHQPAEALKAIEEALTSYQAVAFGEVGMARDIAEAYWIKGKILKALDRWDSAELTEALLSALNLWRDVLGQSRGAVWVLEEFAEVHVRRKAWVEARAAYEEAIRRLDVYDDLNVAFKGLVQRCRDNLNYVQLRESNSFDDSVVFKEPPRC